MCFSKGNKMLSGDFQPLHRENTLKLYLDGFTSQKISSVFQDTFSCYAGNRTEAEESPNPSILVTLFCPMGNLYAHHGFWLLEKN
jgi:hypothetical protein